jgi:hypothetical protein
MNPFMSIQRFFRFGSNLYTHNAFVHHRNQKAMMLSWQGGESPDIWRNLHHEVFAPPFGSREATADKTIQTLVINKISESHH